MVCVYCVSHIPAILQWRSPAIATAAFTLVAWLILVVRASGRAAICLGQKPWPAQAGAARLALETVEGLAGGMLSASLLGMALAPITPFGWWQAGLVALVVTTFSFLGGLIMSAIKARPRRQGLGHAGQGPWRHSGPAGQPCVLGAGLPAYSGLGVAMTEGFQPQAHRQPQHEMGGPCHPSTGRRARPAQPHLDGVGGGGGAGICSLRAFGLHRAVLGRAVAGRGAGLTQMRLLCNLFDGLVAVEDGMGSPTAPSGTRCRTACRTC